MEKEKVLFEAMQEAREVFDEYISDQGYDPAYFQLYQTGYVLDNNFNKLKEIRTNLNATGKEKFQYEDKEIE